MTAPDIVTNVTTEPMLPCVCMDCKRVYKHIPANRVIAPGEVSHGYCPKCTPAFYERCGFSRKQPATLDPEALR
jgi:hypothetical protein